MARPAVSRHRGLWRPDFPLPANQERLPVRQPVNHCRIAARAIGAGQYRVPETNPRKLWQIGQISVYSVFEDNRGLNVVSSLQFSVHMLNHLRSYITMRSEERRVGRQR